MNTTDRYILKMRRPAVKWQDASPCGNGKIGALMYGNIASEYILFNHEDLWLPIYERVKNVNMAPYVKEYRALLEEGRCHEADLFWRNALKEAGWPDFTYENPAHPAFGMLIEQPGGQLFYGYLREIDMESGETRTKWSTETADFERRMFVSRADDMAVINIKTSVKGALNTCIKLKKHPFSDGRYPKKLKESELPLQFVQRKNASDDEFIGIYPNSTGYVGTMHVIAHGAKTKSIAGGVEVSGASEVTVFVKIDKTDMPLQMHHSFTDIEDYALLLKRHKKYHTEIFGRTSLVLSDEQPRTNEDLLDEAYEKCPGAQLYEKLFYYGRYLFICSTPPHGMPPNLQGVWNGEYLPPWACGYTLDENLQMMYWQTLSGNMAELCMPYFEFVEKSLPQWRENAKMFYGCRGILAPLAQSSHRTLAENMPYLHVTCTAGWLAQLFYEYYLYTGDVLFLEKRALPVMEEAALFYKDFSYINENGYISIAPSMSPENDPYTDEPGQKHDSWLRASVSPTIDIAIFKELLTNLLNAYTLLGNEKGAEECKDQLKKFAPYRKNKDGAMAEWQHPKYNDHYRHRHFSQLYPLFPGNEITEKTPELMKMCKKTLEIKERGNIDMFTCWGLVNAALLHIRLFEAESADKCLMYITKSCIGNNFIMNINDNRAMGIAQSSLCGAPYDEAVCQLDANMGFSAVITEMIIRSREETIYVLSALPKRFKNGKLTGAMCKGNITADVLWNEGSVEFKPQGKGERTVKFPEYVTGGYIVFKDGGKKEFSGNTVSLNIEKCSAVTGKT